MAIDATRCQPGDTITLHVKVDRIRAGCDRCRNDRPTERFVGFCGNVLWICDDCIKQMTTNAAQAKGTQ